MVLSMDRWMGKAAIVTAANSSVGASIAAKLVEGGIKVVGLARQVEDIEQLAEKLIEKPGRLYAFRADITKERDIVNAFWWTRKNVGPVHILINNGGIHVSENLSDEKAGAFEKTLDVNVNAMCIATREALKAMMRKNIEGHVIHINSIVGYRITTSKVEDIYPAAKHAITALTDGLRLELNSLKSKIKVTSISPGCTITPTFNIARRKSDLFQQLTAENILEAEDIADAVIYALSTSPHVQIQELSIKPLNEVL